MMRKFKAIKKEIRILGIDDAPFDKFRDKECLVIGTIFRGGSYLDGLISFRIKVDGNDGTKKLISAIKKTKHRGQIQCIVINGISLAGFNVLDIEKISRSVRLPVIVFIRKMPDFVNIRKALAKAKMPGKMTLIKKAGKVYSSKISDRRVFFQIKGISEKEAFKILKLACLHALVPEPLRIAHIIGSGIIFGENRGRA